MKKIGLYQVSILAFFLILPVAAILAQCLWFPTGASLAQTALKWFVFFAVGCRLFTSGLWQVCRPGFTAEDILGVKDKQCFFFIRELGFANLCFGLLGLLSVALPQFRGAAALSGGLYFGLAGVQHIFSKKKTANEWLATLSDLFVFLVLGILFALGGSR